QSRPRTDVHGMKVNGGSLPATIFNRFMTRATRDPRYDSTAEFAKPSTFPGKVLGARVAFVETTPSTTPSTVKQAKASTTVVRPTTPTTAAATPLPTQPAPKPTTPPPTNPPGPPPTNPSTCQYKPTKCQPPP